MNEYFPYNKIIENPDQIILTIYTGQEHLSFSIYNPKEIGSYFFKELIEEDPTDTFSALKAAFLNNTLFSLPFRKVFIMHRTISFAYIPNFIYKEKNEEDFMHFLFSDHNGITLSHTISNAGCKVLYKLPEDIYNFALRSFSNPEFIHYSESIINYFLKISNKFKNRRMIANLNEKGLDIFCFSKNAFLLGNYYQCINMQEALYFILFAWKQLQFNQSDDDLYISGDSSFKNMLSDKLALYIQNIHRLDLPLVKHFEGIEISRIPIELAVLSL